MTAVLFQALAAAVVAGVSIAWITYALGLDRIAVMVIRHPLQSFEIAYATVVLIHLPAPKVKRKSRHAT